MTFSLAIQLLIRNGGIVECTKHEHMYTMASSKGNNLNRMQYLLYPLSKKKRIEIEQMPDTDQYTATFKETKSATMNIFQFFFIFFLNHLLK